MKLLIDTHIFLWFLRNDGRLCAKARGWIEDGRNEIHLSAASLWEIAIKISVGKLRLEDSNGVPQDYDSFLTDALEANRISLLAIAIPHLAVLTSLPFHHRDPFDRLLIAQSISEGLPIISIDAAFDAYPIQRLWE